MTNNDFFEIKEMSNFKSGILSTHFEMKFGNLRKPQTFYCGSPIQKDDKNLMYITSDKRIGLIDFNTGLIKMSKNLNRHPVHADVAFNKDKKQVKFTPEQLSKFIEQYNKVSPNYGQITL